MFGLVCIVSHEEIMAEITLTLGPVHILEEDVIYRLPARQCLLFSSEAVQVSNDVTFVTSASISGNTSTPTSAQYVRSTTAATAIRVVA
jgi:hypothetical protein